MTLRFRLVLLLTALLLVGLLVAGGLTHALLQAFLLERVDQQLRAAQGPVLFGLVSGETRLSPPVDPALLPPGTVGELVGFDGRVISGPKTLLEYPGQQVNPPPDLPQSISLIRASRLFSSGAEGQPSTRYRLLAEAVSIPEGEAVLVVAIPLQQVADTLKRLLLIEAAVAAGVTVCLGALCRWAVRRELGPLDRMADTAGRIAGGDLSQRVEKLNESTEVGRLGAALNKMLTQVEETDHRLRRFLADASHELRTPLTLIQGHSELFRRGTLLGSEALTRSMTVIEEESQRMSVVIDELLALARQDVQQPVERKPVDLKAVVKDSIASFMATHPASHISLDSQGSPIISGDRARLRLVADNLIENALQHAPDSARVHVRVGTDHNGAFLEVEDEGSGMESAHLGHLLEPFYRPDPARTRSEGGPGLGLSIVRAVVDAHGGKIEMQSPPGEGLRVRVSLPIETSTP